MDASLGLLIAVVAGVGIALRVFCVFIGSVGWGNCDVDIAEGKTRLGRGSSV